MYRLIFLGTSSGDMISRKGSNGIVFIIDDFQILIDPGPSLLQKARDYNVKLENTNLILVSHNHLTHCNDLNLLIETMTYRGMDNKGILIGDDATIYGTRFERPILGRRQEKLLERVVALKEKEKVNLGTLKIEALKTKHCNMAIGFKIHIEKFILTYTGDTAYFKEMKEEYKGSNLMILNNVKPFNYKSDNNLTSEDTVKILKEVKPQFAIITHFGKLMQSVNPIYEAREIQRSTDIQTVAAKEGLMIDPLSYSNALRQKTLDIKKL